MAFHPKDTTTNIGQNKTKAPKIPWQGDQSSKNLDPDPVRYARGQSRAPSSLTPGNRVTQGGIDAAQPLTDPIMTSILATGTANSNLDWQSRKVRAEPLVSAHGMRTRENESSPGDLAKKANAATGTGKSGTGQP